MQLLEVSVHSTYYNQGVQLRKQLFFDGFKDADTLISDAYETNSIHLVALENKLIIGTGRLTYIKNTAIISQMTVAPEFQKSGIGSEILNYLMALALKNSFIDIIELNARVIALPFYKKFGFVTVGEIYPSKKTGVLHQSMVYSKN